MTRRIETGKAILPQTSNVGDYKLATYENKPQVLSHIELSLLPQKKPKENFVPTTIARVPHSFEHYWRHLHGTFHLGTTII
jgi:hypothetical protein